MVMKVMMRVMMKVIQMKRSHILYHLSALVLLMKTTTKITWNKHTLLFNMTIDQ